MHTHLLLGGSSQRFWPLKEKPLFPVCGKTLLEHQVNRLKQAGCENITLIGSKDNLSDIKRLFPGLKTIQQRENTAGMYGALITALPECKSDSVLIVSGNDVIEPSAYKDLIKSAKKGVAGALLAQKVSQYFPGGYLTLEDDRITGIVEKPGEGNEPSDLVNIVAHIHNDASILMDALNKTDGAQDDAYEQALQILFKDHLYRAVSYEGDWRAVKYPWHLLDLLPLFLTEIKDQIIDPSVSIHPTAVIDGPVIIEKGTRIFPHAAIRGPCYIGSDCIIANNALVRNSSIGTGSVVGFCTEVKASIFASQVWTHMNYVGDSVFGNNVSLGAGIITGNLRLDEKIIDSLVKGEKVSTQRNKFGNIIGDNCRLGIQVGLNPGIKIGAGSFISSGCLLPHDVPDGRFVRLKKGEIIMSENRERLLKPEDRDGFKSKL